jgi:hypothetical protein
MTDVNGVPEIAVARPKDARVAWQVYLDGAIKVRRLNSGVVEIATGDADWKEVD